MNKKTEVALKNTTKKIWQGLVVAALGAALLFYASASRQNIVRTLLLAVETVIPSLFPMLILSDFSVRTGLFRPHGKRFCRLLHRFFGISENGFAALLFGLCGGYLTGVKTAVSLFEAGAISGEEARHLSLFCVSPGLAFCITAVGDAMLGSKKLGFLFFITCTVTALLTGVICRPKKQLHTVFVPTQMKDTVGIAFCGSVRKSADAMLSLAAWMAVFAAAQGILESILPQSAAPFCRLLAEVTNAVHLCVQNKNLSLCAAALAFGGLCIFCQLLPELNVLNLRPLHFLTVRFLNGIGAGLLFECFSLLLPDQTALPCLYRRAKPFSTTPLSAFFLLFACLFFVLDLAPTRKTCYTVNGR